MSKAQNPAAPKLFGSGLEIETILPKSNLVFVGEITHLIKGPAASPDMHTNFVEVKVLQVLRGSVGAQIRFTMDILAANDSEAVPKAGDVYLFFIEQNTGRNTALKLLPSTGDNIAKIKALIAAAPPSK